MRGDLEYRGWAIRLEVTPEGDAIFGRADLAQLRNHKIRVVLTSSRIDEPNPRIALYAQARDFIDQWYGGPASVRQRRQD